MTAPIEGRLVMVWPVTDVDRTVSELRTEAAELLAESLTERCLKAAGPADYHLAGDDTCPVLVATVAVTVAMPVRRPAPRALVPCGTPSAAKRHKNRGEPVDPRCLAALRQHDMLRARARVEAKRALAAAQAVA